MRGTKIPENTYFVAAKRCRSGLVKGPRRKPPRFSGKFGQIDVNQNRPKEGSNEQINYTS